MNHCCLTVSFFLLPCVTHNTTTLVSERKNVPSLVNFAGIVDDRFESKSLLSDEDSNSSYSDSDMFSRKNPKRDEDPLGQGSKPETDDAPLTPPPRGLEPPSPNRSTRANISKMGRSVNRPVEEKPLLDEIREVMAQSSLLFMLTDLRYMSATGRISTKFENLAMDSDIWRRDTAKRMACLTDNGKDDDTQQIGHFKGLSPALMMAIVILEIRDEVVRAAEEKAAKKKVGRKAKYASSEDIDNDDQFVSYENNSKKKKLTEESMMSLMICYSRMVSEDLVSEIPSLARRRATFHPYNFSMSAGNLFSPSGEMNRNSQGPFTMFGRKSLSAEGGFPPKPPYGFPMPGKISRGSSAPVTSSINTVLQSVKEEQTPSEGFEMVRTSGAGSSVPGTGLDNIESGGIPMTPIAERKDSTNSKASQSNASQSNTSQSNASQSNAASSFKDETMPEVPEVTRKSSLQLFSPGKWNRERTNSEDSTPMPAPASFREKMNLTRENSKMFADKIKTDFNQQVDNLLTANNPEALRQKEFEELTNVFFDQGEMNEDIKAELGETYSREEMVEVIRNAVASRDSNRLQFFSKFFKKGSFSRLLAESHARVVWCNDWYPEKDPTYAISVDTHQRRVMVVFRGAITMEDWLSALKMKFHTIRNPIKEDYENKNQRLRVYFGLYKHLFRKRKDTGTTKYDEIANMAYKYGMERIGPNFNLFVTGHSLGGAFTNFFTFFASLDERFTKNGPVKGIAFANPYMGGHSWADAFRHQERQKKLQLVLVRNHSDAIPRLPGNFRIGRRGPLWRHVGIGVTLPAVPRFGCKWKPTVHYWGKEKSWLDSTIHLSKRNLVFHLPYLQPWKLDRSHKLEELQDRMMYGELNSEEGGGFMLLQHTLDELYEKLEENDFQHLSRTKLWGLHRRGKQQGGAGAGGGGAETSTLIQSNNNK